MVINTKYVIMRWINMGLVYKDKSASAKVNKNVKSTIFSKQPNTTNAPSPEKILKEIKKKKKK